MRTLVCLLLAVTVLSQTWSVQKPDLATVLIGCAFVSPAEGFLAGDDNGYGPIILKTTDGGNTYTHCNHSGYSMMYLSVAAGSATNGVVTGIGMGRNFRGIEYTTDGNTFAPTAHDYLDVSQNVEAMKGVSGGFGITGTFNQDNGVSVTTDQGVTWNHYNCSATTEARYGSFPSRNTWYVSAGMWPGYYTQKKESSVNGFKQLTQRLRVRPGAGMETTFDEEINRGSKAGPSRSLLQVPAYYAQISKTNDGGKTWNTVFHDEGNFYFNGIDCVDEQNCWVVGESESDSLTPGVRILHTGDGGATWEVQLYIADPTYSILDIAFVNATEGWATGGILTQTHFTGEFWHTVDGGKSWTTQNITGVYGTALSFVWSDAAKTNYVGWATAFTRSGQSSVCMYK